jgi:hypothetical protein
MSKPKKPRPDKYAGKLKLKTGLEDTLKLFANAANKRTKGASAHATNDQEPLPGT